MTSHIKTIIPFDGLHIRRTEITRCISHNMDNRCAASAVKSFRWSKLYFWRLANVVSLFCAFFAACEDATEPVTIQRGTTFNWKIAIMH